MKIKNIAFIGLGNMGFHMANQLIKKRYKNLFHCLKKIYAEEGPSALWKSAWARCVSACT